MPRGETFTAPADANDRYAHGTRARYALGKCRCRDCAFANCEYQNARAAALRKPWRVRHVGGGYYIVQRVAGGEIVFRSKDRAAAMRRRNKLNGDLDGPLPDRELVSTAPILHRVALLRKNGIGYRTIASRAAVNPSILVRILSGNILKTRRSTVRRILAVEVRLPEAALVDARSTWEKLNALIEAGHSRRKLARLLGSTATSPALQVRRDRVLASTARKVARLYASLTSPATPAKTPLDHLRLRLHQQDCIFYAEGASSRCAQCRSLAA